MRTKYKVILERTGSQTRADENFSTINPCKTVQDDIYNLF